MSNHIRSGKLTAIALALLIGAGLTGCGKGREARDGEYYNKANKFSLIPPAGWATEEETSDGVFLFTLTGEDEDSIAVITLGAAENAKGTVVLDSFAAGAVKGIADSMDSFDILTESSADVAGQPCRMVTANAVTEEIPAKAMVWCFVKGPRGYTVNALVAPPEALDRYLPIIEKTVASFRAE